MKKIGHLLVLIALMFSVVDGIGQYTTKDKSNKQEGEQDSELTAEVLFRNTTRNEDIRVFNETLKKMESAIYGKSIMEAEIFRDELVKLTKVEIARSNYDLSELKKGNTANLEKWYAIHKPDKTIILNMEISELTNRINHDQYLTNKIKTFDLSDLSNDRVTGTLVSYLKTFAKNMMRNLKYSSDERLSDPKPPQGDTGSGQETIEGPGYSTKTGGTEVILTDDPRMENYLLSKDERKKEYMTGLSKFENYMKKSDEKMAKKEYKNLLNLMMNEVNSNNWMLNMINSGVIKSNTIIVSDLTSTVSKQKPIMDQASELRSSLSADPSGLTVALDLAKNFGLTL